MKCELRTLLRDNIVLLKNISIDICQQARNRLPFMAIIDWFTAVFI
jgi:hypothetical protein